MTCQRRCFTLPLSRVAWASRTTCADPVNATSKDWETFQSGEAWPGPGVGSYRWTLWPEATERQIRAGNIVLQSDRYKSGYQGARHRGRSSYQLWWIGYSLKDCSKVPAMSKWVTSGSRLMTGKSFVDALHVRAGCLYTKVRASWGRNTEGACSLTCEVCPCKSETLSRDSAVQEVGTREEWAA